MSTPKKPVPLAGSERTPLEGAREVGPAGPNEIVDVTIRLRSRSGKKPFVDAGEFSKPIENRKILSREEFEKQITLTKSSSSGGSGFSTDGPGH